MLDFVRPRMDSGRPPLTEEQYLLLQRQVSYYEAVDRVNAYAMSDMHTRSLEEGGQDLVFESVGQRWKNHLTARKQGQTHWEYAVHERGTEGDANQRLEYYDLTLDSGGVFDTTGVDYVSVVNTANLAHRPEGTWCVSTSTGDTYQTVHLDRLGSSNIELVLAPLRLDPDPVPYLDLDSVLSSPSWGMLDYLWFFIFG
jgi:hypothetical protein